MASLNSHPKNNELGGANTCSAVGTLTLCLFANQSEKNVMSKAVRVMTICPCETTIEKETKNNAGPFFFPRTVINFMTGEELTP